MGSDNKDDVFHDKEEEFIKQCLPAPPFFLIPSTAWTKLRKTQKKASLQGTAVD